MDELRVAPVEAPVQLRLLQLESVADLVAHEGLIHALWLVIIIEAVVVLRGMELSVVQASVFLPIT